MSDLAASSPGSLASSRSAGNAPDASNDRSTRSRFRLSPSSFLLRARLFFRRPLVLLTLITLLGAVLRFADLANPAIWGDEGMTWSRVCGTWQELTDTLRTDGLFTPGSYLTLWWIKEGFPVWGQFATEASGNVQVGEFVPTHRLAGGPIALTPFWMRLVPALCGVAMIPATYFLAVQLVARRTALLAAMFACCSAFLLAYSRDAKMYMQAYFLATLNAACLLWWIDLRRTREGDLRPRSPIRFLCWVLSGSLMACFHATALIALLPQLLIVLTAPRAWPVGAIAALWRRMRDNRDVWRAAVPRRRVDGPPSTSAQPIEPVTSTIVAEPTIAPPAAEDRRTPARAVAHPPLYVVLPRLIPLVVWFALGAALISLPAILWFTQFNQRVEEVVPGPAGADAPPWMQSRVDPEFADEPQFNADRAGLGWIELYNKGRSQLDHWGFTFGAYLMSWELPLESQWSHVDPFVGRLLFNAFIGLLIALALGLMGLRRVAGFASLDRFAPAGRSTLAPRRTMWIVAGILLPLYAIYCLSVQPAYSPWEALQFTFDFSTPSLSWIAIGLLTWGLLHLLLLGRGRFSARLLRLLGYVTLFAVLFGALRLLQANLPPQQKNLWMPRYPGMVWPFVAIGASALLLRLPTKPLRYFCIAVLLAINLGNFAARTWGPSEPRQDRVINDIVRARADESLRVYYYRGPGRGGMFSGAPGEASLRSMPSTYYAHLVTPELTPAPLYVRWGNWSFLRKAMGEWKGRITIYVIDPQRARDAATDGGASRIARDLTQPSAKDVRRFVLWQELTRDDAESNVDPFDGKLPPGWKRVSLERLPVHDHWTWRKTFELRRYEYEQRG